MSAGEAPSSRAAAPATCGLAIDVPDSSFVDARPGVPVPRRRRRRGRTGRRTSPGSRTPGAGVARGPVAATVSTESSRPGEDPHASASSLPAAAATVTPSATSPRTAASTASLGSPARLRFATAGAPGGGRGRPSRSRRPPPDVSPEPSQSSVRTATSDTALATPGVAPPIVRRRACRGRESSVRARRRPR